MTTEQKESPRVAHDTIVFERIYDASTSDVFQAYADAKQRVKWHFPGADWEIASFEQDFKVGGQERSRFGPKGNANLLDVGTFLDIVPNSRIVSAGTMHEDGERLSITLLTIELTAVGREQARLKLTDQSAFLAGETPADRRNGWGQVLSKLEAYLAARKEKA